MTDKNEPEKAAFDEVKEPSKSEVIPPVGGIKGAIDNVSKQPKFRAVERRRELLEMNKTRTTKWLHGDEPQYEDTPPKFRLGKFSLSSAGGIATLQYVVYMRDPRNGNRVNTLGGGGIVTHFVTETFRVGKGIDQSVVENQNAPSLKQALKNWQEYLDREKSRVVQPGGR